MKTERIKPSDVLQACADVLLGNPEAHTKITMARTSPTDYNKYGNPIATTDTAACCWCALGLIDVAASDLDIPNRDILFKSSADYFKRANKAWSITKFNDAPDRTPEQVQAAFQKAADLAVHDED